MHNASTKGTGALGENIAVQFLQKKGYTILERNYSKPWGEIDIIALRNNVVRFVEVKAVRVPEGALSRENGDYFPEEQIHAAKLQKIVRTAELYMSGKGDAREYQIDAVGVLLDTVNRRARCRLFEQIL